MLRALKYLRLHRFALVVASSLVVGSCGGGGGAASQSSLFLLAPSCEISEACSATSSTTYSGSGVGIWDASNQSTSPISIDIAISGLSGQDVTLIFTNGTATGQTMTPIQTSLISGSSLLTSTLLTPESEEKARIREFNRTGWAEAIRDATSSSSSGVWTAPDTPLATGVGSTRGFYHYDQSTRQTTLRAQVTKQDGTVVNLWVEDGEYLPNRITQAQHVDVLIEAFTGVGKIYDSVKDIGGPPWGGHSYPNELIPGSNQPVDIVLLNFNNDGQPYGTIGYFWSLHNLRKVVDSRSNESLSLYLDTETLYLGGHYGMKYGMSTLIHEAAHMANFYRRSVKMGPGYGFDTWLEEMSAMMMEDAVSSRVLPDFNMIRDLRFAQYLGSAAYNCPLTVFTISPCDSYSVTGSFGAFLLRQLGVPFYKNMLAQTTTNTQLALDNAIKTVRSDSSMSIELRRFAAAAIGALPATGTPARFAFAAREDSGYSIPLIAPDTYTRNLPGTVPPTLNAYASFPVLRPTISGTYTETVQVPAGTTLSVVIH